MIRQMHSLLIIHFGSNILSNICYVSTGFKILRFTRSISDINNFVTLFNCLLQGMHKQNNKHGAIKSMLD